MSSHVSDDDSDDDDYDDNDDTDEAVVLKHSSKGTVLNSRTLFCQQ